MNESEKELQEMVGEEVQENIYEKIVNNPTVLEELNIEQLEEVLDKMIGDVNND